MSNQPHAEVDDIDACVAHTEECCAGALLLEVCVDESESNRVRLTLADRPCDSFLHVLDEGAGMAAGWADIVLAERTQPYGIRHSLAVAADAVRAAVIPQH